jgi:hypothetical protein
MKRRSLRLLVLLAALAVSSSAPASTREPPHETKDRISARRLKQLVREPIQLVEAGRRDRADAVFLKLLGAARARGKAGAVRVADLLTAYGVALYDLGEESETGDTRSAAIKWLEQAVAATRSAWGSAHPETALALQNLADVIREINPEAPGAEAEAALREAYRIRLKALGPGNPETMYALKSLGDVLSAGPDAATPDAARAREAEEIYRRAITTWAAVRSDFVIELQMSARLKLARLLARSGRAAAALAEASEAERVISSLPKSDSAPCFAYGLAIGQLADALEAHGAAAQAERLRDGAAEIRERCLGPLLP